MSEACTHDCSNCHADCSSRAPQHEPPHAKSHIKKVIGVVSGKGGVGKSMTSAMMAVSMRRKGYKVGVLDADITGPSIPKLFGVHGPAMGTEDGINPVESHTGIKIMSINLLLEDEEAPVVWRGPVIAGAVKQFWQGIRQIPLGRVWRHRFEDIHLRGAACACAVLSLMLYIG